MQKKKYAKAEIEVFSFDKKDVITASGLVGPEVEGPDNPGVSPDSVLADTYLAQ